MLFKVSPEDASERIDRFVSQRAGITRSQIKNLIAQSLVIVNGKPAKPNYKVRQGDIVEVSVPEKNVEALVPEDIPIEILYSDEHIAVVNKPAGLVVHPAAGHRCGTLLNALLHRFKHLATIGAPLRPGVVHRLDKDTSGIMVVALDDRAYYDLVHQFKERTIQRSYQAIVYGNPKADKGEITLGIGRSPHDRKKMSTRSRRAKVAKTTWKVLQRFPSSSLIEARLATGRTHQIRVHLASIGHPVLGDRTYGKKTMLRIKGKTLRMPRQMLHAELLGFTHPITGKALEFRTAVPEDMERVLEELKALSAPV